jgi:aryl-alcohol dehydrogenase-like predicted oxidoreductase
MKTRPLGSTGFEVSEVGFGAWAIGADWGHVEEDVALDTLETALDSGMTLIDTADVYGDGRSERLVARVNAGREHCPTVATKAGRRLDPHVAIGYTPANIEAFVDRSREYLQQDTLDLVQLHCPPTEVYYDPTLFAGLDRLKAAGKVAHYGVSVEKVEEAIKAIEYPGVESVQIIFNVFRQRPRERFFAMAAERNVGILARVPLASGLLTGKMTPTTEFTDDDHRSYNRHGESFDVGETFSGVDYDRGLRAVEELRELVPEGATMAQLALRWILMHPEVSAVIPGAKTPEQAGDNARASELPALSPEAMARVARIYDEHIRADVHQRW